MAWAGALVQWLCETTPVQEVVGSNPSAAYWVVILSHLFVVKIVLFVWKRSKKTKKRPGLAHFLKKTSNGFSFENWTLLTYVPQETLINLWPILLILSIVIYFTSIVGGMGSNPPPPKNLPALVDHLCAKFHQDLSSGMDFQREHTNRHCPLFSRYLWKEFQVELDTFLRYHVCTSKQGVGN